MLAVVVFGDGTTHAEDKDLVGVHHGGQAVGNDECRAVDADAV